MGCSNSTNLQQQIQNFLNSKNISIWQSQLQFLKKQSQLTCNTTNYISPYFFSYFFQKIQNFYLNNQQKYQFIELINDLIITNTTSTKISFSYCENISKKITSIYDRIYFKNKYCLKYCQFIGSKIILNKRQFQIYFSQLKFDLKTDQLEKLCTVVIAFCQHNLQAFAFIALYLKLFIDKEIIKGQMSIIQIEQTVINKLKNLQKIYPASNIMTKNDAQLQSIQNLKDINFQQEQYIEFSSNNNNDQKLVQNQQNLSVTQKKSNYQLTKSFIINKHQMAKKQQSILNNLIKNICLQKGYGYKTSTKIKNQNDLASIFRIIQKLLYKKEYQNEFQTNMKSNQIVLVQQEKQNKTKKQLKRQQIYDNMVQKQKEKIQQKIKNILQKKQKILFDSKDLLRGKCLFDSITDIISTVDKLKSHIQSKGYKIVQLSNRLNKKTKDVKIIIKLSKSLAEFQLCLKTNHVQNEFNHKIYQLLRSKVYTPIVNIYVHYQKWCKNFFNNQYEIFNYVTKYSPQLKLQSNFSFKQLSSQMIDFRNKILKQIIIKLQSQQINQSQQKLDKKVQDKIKQIKRKLQNQKQNIRKNKYQKINNQLYFLFKIQNYDKALQRINVYLQEDKNINSFAFYQICGDIYKRIGKYEQSLPYYKKGLQLNPEAGSILNNMSLSYQKLKQYNKSIQMLEKAIQLAIKKQGPNSSIIQVYQNNLGNSYMYIKQYKKAQQIFNQSLQKRQKLYGKQHFQCKVVLHNLGWVNLTHQNFQKALNYYERALYLVQKNLGKESFQSVITLRDLAQTHQYLNQYNISVKYYLRVIELYQKNYQKISLDDLFIYYKIITYYQIMGDLDKTNNYFQKINNILLREKKNNGKQYATYIYRLGYHQFLRKDYSKSLQYFLNSKKNLQSVPEDQRESGYTSFLYYFGQLCLQTSKYSQALNNFKTNLQLELKKQNPQVQQKDKQQQICKIKLKISLSYYKLNQIQQSKKLILQTIQSIQRYNRINTVQGARSYNILSLIFHKQKNLQKSIQYAKKSLEIFNSTRPKTNHQVIQANEYFEKLLVEKGQNQKQKIINN